MTDHSRVPQPRRHAAIAGRPTPAAGLNALRGRMLVQVAPRRVGLVLQQLDGDRSGLVLCGEGAMKKAAVLRETDAFAGPFLLDPAAYEVRAASEDEPFPRTEQEGLFLKDPLKVSLTQQRALGVAAPLTPTGYLHAEDSGALRAAVERVNDLDDPAAVFSVPLDVAWLRDEESTRQLIAYLKMVKNAKAVMLGGQMDPLARFANAVGNLQRVFDEVPDTALLRSDLAAFGALAHGAAFTAFGASSRLRHVVPPNERARTSKGFAGSPHVLYPELMDFFLGETLAKRFAVVDVPMCACTACEGRWALDSFSSNRSPLPTAACAHNIATLMQWLRELHTTNPGTQRRDWWQEQCRRATEHYTLLNASLQQKDLFEAPEQLKRWATLTPGAVPHGTASPHRTR